MDTALIMEATKREGADIVGVVNHGDDAVVVMGFASNGHVDLKAVDEKAKAVSERIVKAGFSASVISACERSGVSLRRLAEKAGLGFIGRSGLLITERYGPDVRFVGLRINTPLQVDEKDDSVKEGCGECILCVTACPAGAIESGDMERCRTYVEGLGEGRCTVCIEVCPFKVRR